MNNKHFILQRKKIAVPKLLLSIKKAKVVTDKWKSAGKRCFMRQIKTHQGDHLSYKVAFALTD